MTIPMYAQCVHINDNKVGVHDMYACLLLCSDSSLYQ